MPKLRPADRPELTLVQGARTERVDVFDLAQVFRRFAPYVATVARRLLGDEAEVEDIVQEVFVEAHHGLEKLRDPGAVRPWLGRICVRRSVKRLRQRRIRRVLSLENAPDYADLVAPGASPEQKAQVAHVYRLLDEIGTLSRVAWILKFVEGEPLDEIARLCACSKSTVQRRLRAADAFLRERGVHG